MTELSGTFFWNDNLLFEHEAHYIHTAYGTVSFTPESALYDDIHILFDGTLYNSTLLQSELNLPDSADTTEVLSEGYRKWGIASLLRRAEGIFSLVLFDERSQKLILARDHTGVKPLYYYHTQKFFAFSSSLRKLSEKPFFEKRLSSGALSDYFTYGFILQPETIFDKCHKVRSGHFLVYDISQRTLHEERYWGLGACYDQCKLDMDEVSLQQEIERVFYKSLQKRLVGISDYGVALSGGYDSSTLAALLQSQSSRKIKTFTIGFEDAEFNEAPDAKKIAVHLGTEHTEYYFTAQDALQTVPMLPEVFDEPFFNNGAIPTILLAKIVHGSETKNLFVGDGGDEVFATADDVERFEQILGFPRTIRRGAAKLLAAIDPTGLPYLRHYKNAPTRYYKMVQLLNAEDIPRMVQLRMMLFYPHEQRKLLQKEAQTERNLFSQIGFGKHAEGVDQIIGSYFKSLLINAELVKTTQTLGYYGIDPRTPYLDKELIALMARVPGALKIKGGVKKYFLKNIAYAYIPKALLDRPKRGFSIPFSHWMRKELRGLLEETLSETKMHRDGLFDAGYVTQIKREFYRGNEDYKYKLWAIFLFQLWYDRHMGYC
ncbi:MAG: hypothetical protein DSZ05_08065 [Sulfurospirillum sp.]|nr:MAG: hypothetical protein DSZ05_08065 [Sulfurospirillum sp.]